MSLYHLISSHPVVSCCIMFYLVNWAMGRTSIPIIPSHQPKSKGQSACWATWRSLRPPRQAPSTSLELRGPLAAAHRSSAMTFLGGNGWNRQMQHATRMEHEWKSCTWCTCWHYSDFTHEQTDYSFVGVGFLKILCDMLSHGPRRNFVQKILESHPRQMKLSLPT